jgi:hypothetical protein
MSIPILISPALFDIVLVLVFMLSSVASQPPTRQPMIIYISNRPTNGSVGNILSAKPISRLRIELRVSFGLLCSGGFSGRDLNLDLDSGVGQVR